MQKFKIKYKPVREVKKCYSISWVCAISEAFLTTVIKFHITYSCISWWGKKLHICFFETE